LSSQRPVVSIGEVGLQSGSKGALPHQSKPDVARLEDTIMAVLFSNGILNKMQCPFSAHLMYLVTQIDAAFLLDDASLKTW
jgi:hypothetical protein